MLTRSVGVLEWHFRGCGSGNGCTVKAQHVEEHDNWDDVEVEFPDKFPFFDFVDFDERDRRAFLMVRRRWHWSRHLVLSCHY